MARQVFTAADIRRIHAEQKAGALVLGPQDLITPEAADLAAELGLRLVREQANGKNTAPSGGSSDNGAAAGPSSSVASGALLKAGGLPPLRVVARAQVALD